MTPVSLIGGRRLETFIYYMSVQPPLLSHASRSPNINSKSVKLERYKAETWANTSSDGSTHPGACSLSASQGPRGVRFSSAPVSPRHDRTGQLSVFSDLQSLEVQTVHWHHFMEATQTEMKVLPMLVLWVHIVMPTTANILTSSPLYLNNSCYFQTAEKMLSAAS